jgi:hypothetical protein
MRKYTSGRSTLPDYVKLPAQRRTFLMTNEDRAFLDEYSQTTGLPQAEILRRAIATEREARRLYELGYRELSSNDGSCVLKFFGPDDYQAYEEHKRHGEKVQAANTG